MKSAPDGAKKRRACERIAINDLRMRSGKAALCAFTVVAVFAFGAAFFNGAGEDSKQAAAQPMSGFQDGRQAIVSMSDKKDEMFISWKGDDDEPKFLRFSEDKYALAVTEPIKAERKRILGDEYYRYKVRLTGLEQGKIYYYEIGDGTVYDSPRFFSVPDGDGEDVFAYLGDPQFDNDQGDYERWGGLVRSMHEKNPDIEFVVMGGDMVNVPTRAEQWNCFLDNCGVFAELPLMTVPGNHEGVTSNNTYKNLFHHVNNGPASEAFYWFESDNCRFVMLDSSFLTGARRSAMGQALWSVRKQEIERWLKKSLEESRKTWNIVVSHHPVYGMHDIFTVSEDIREYWLPIMKASGADLVLCGHQHAYMRTRQMDGITYVMGVSGAKRSNYYHGFNEPTYSRAVYAAGGNYQIFRATEERLEIVSYDEKGEVIDSAHIDSGITPPYFRTFW